MVSYLTLAREAEAEIEVKRSRFLCTLRRVEDEAGARAVVEALRSVHRKRDRFTSISASASRARVR